MEVDLGGLHAAAAQLAAAAETLAALAAAPPLHPPLAADEVSTSAAGRLNAAGAVLASRAGDGAAVLGCAAQALGLAATTYQSMNAANARLVSLRGSTGPTPVAMPTLAVTTDAEMPLVPIAAPVPRPGELASAIVHAGDPHGGAGFVTTVGHYANAFDTTASATHNAAQTVTAAVKGEAGPRISAALDRFAGWAEQMGEHSSTLGQLAEQHSDRFSATQRQTPTPQEFESNRRELSMALGSRNPALVAKTQSDLVTLTNRVSMAATSYHVGELPQAPPPPPPVVHVVEPAPSADGTAASGNDPNDERARQKPGMADPGAAPDGDPLEAPGDESDPLTGDSAAAGVVPGGDSMAQGIGPLVSALPGMVAGLAGGVVGMAASVPAQIGQQVQSAAGAAMQSFSGLNSARSDPSDGDLSSPVDGLSDTGGLGDSGGGGGGDGSTEPASAGGDLSGAPMAGMGGPTGVGPALTGYTGGPPPSAGSAAGAGLAGAPPMGMMPMGGMGGMNGAAGGSGSKAVKDPDREIHLPKRPHADQMRTSDKTVTADQRPQPPPEDKPVVTVKSKRRSDIVMPPKGGNAGGER